MTVNGVAVAVGATVPGDYGTLTITSIVGTTVNYSYTLADNVDHDTDLTPYESFTVAVADSDGNPADDASSTFQIEIVDDVPSAAADIDSVTEDGPTVANGNVLTAAAVGSPDANTDDGVADVQGADGATVTGVAAGTPASASGQVGSAVPGSYGSITIGAEGAYVYTLDNGNAAVQALTTGQTLTDTFTYTITDNDGDASTTTVTITINGSNDTPTVTVPQAGAPGTEVSEAGLPARAGEPAGSASGGSSETTTGSFSYTHGDGASTVTVNGVAVAVGATVPGDYGTLTITSIVGTTVNYSYTLADNVDHDTDLTPYESFTVAVADSDGNPADDASSTFQIQIVDDVPSAAADIDSVTEDGPTVANGNVLTAAAVGSPDANTDDGVADVQGADGATVTGVAAGTPASASGQVGLRCRAATARSRSGRQLCLYAGQRQCSGAGADHRPDADRHVHLHDHRR